MLQLSPVRKNYLIKIGISVLGLIISIFAVQWIAERFFFDLFFYQKSVKYGYILAKKNARWKDFGKRAADVITLTKHPERFRSSQDLFTVAIIGDSFVWGQGIRNEDRFAEVLQKKINKIRPARVLSLALCGDSLYDNYIKYHILMRIGARVDFFVFGLVDNDLILRNYEQYKSDISAERSFGCPGPFLYNPLFNPQAPDEAAYQRAVKQSFDDSFGNLCLLNRLAEKLPKVNAIYMTFGRNSKNPLMATYMNTLRDRGLRVVTVQDYPEVVERYKKNKIESFQVSPKDGHPSALANKMFADMIWQELSDRGFLSQK